MTRRIYGRTEYAEPLQEFGAVDDDDDDDDVRERFPGDWVELIAFPEEAIRWIVRAGAEVEDEHAVT